MTSRCFIVPHDVLFLRGNRLFGEPGSHGESLMPPWPSVVAGALRSWMLAEAGIDFAEFAAGRVAHPELGTPAAPGSFAVTAFHLARERDGAIETLHRLPADLEVAEAGDGSFELRRLRPARVPAGVLTSCPTPALPVLASRDRHKAASGWWLTQPAWDKYLRGEVPTAGECVHSRDLWRLDHRVGVGLDRVRRSAAEGQLYSAQAIALGDGLGARHSVGRVGFLVQVAGARLPSRGVLRFGGDGRSATVAGVSHEPPEADFDRVVRDQRCRFVLTSPGLFAQGWLPDGVHAEGQGWRFEAPGIRARMIAAAVPRAETVSGFDLARWKPKPAQRAAATGSVYWLTQVEATTEALRKLAETGLWAKTGETASRRAEGFNRLVIANY